MINLEEEILTDKRKTDEPKIGGGTVSDKKTKKHKKRPKESNDGKEKEEETKENKDAKQKSLISVNNI
jgi:hypothetical protein